MSRFRALTRRSVLFLAVLGAVLLLGACSGEPPLDLSAPAATGRDIANANGCAACHGKNGQGNTGPAWQGLYLSRVKLEGAATVLADDDYLRRSIVDPSAEIRRGYTLKMPVKELTDSQVDSILDYIRELQ